MTESDQQWKVLPHGPLSELDSGILGVVGDLPMPLTHLPRRMTVVRLRGGGLLIWSAVSLDAAGMVRLEAYGRPEFLVVPSDHHRHDAAAWKARYPELKVVAPAGAREKIAETVAVDTTTPDFGDPDVRFAPVPGTRDSEAALTVHRPSGTTLVVNDIVGNIRHAAGFGGWLLRLMGLAGDEAQVPKAVALMIVKDKAALREQLLRWADTSDLKRIVVSHGDVIDADPHGVLRELAAALE